MVRLILTIVSMLTLTACSGKDGLDGNDIEQKDIEFTLEATKGISSFYESYNKELYILIPQNINVQLAHSSGSHGWITLELGNKTFCYFAQGATSAASSRNYSLNVVREGLDTSCQTGTGTNTSYNLIHKTNVNEGLRLNLHTPRIANGDVVELTLEGVYYE